MGEPSFAVRSAPYPVLEAGSLSYPEGSYAVSAEAAGDGASVTITHKLSGAPFIEERLAAGSAEYGCLVSVPKTAYRKLHRSREPVQTVGWPSNVVGEPPLLRPLVVTVEALDPRLGRDDGVAEPWQGRRLHLPCGARLAEADYLRAVSSRFDLLSVHPDKTRKPGSFVARASTEDGYYFRVDAAPDIYAFVQHPADHPRHRRSIVTHMASRCFELLAEESRKNEAEEGESWWAQYRNLAALAAELRRQGLPTWDDEHFRPEEAATKLWPHEPPATTSGD